MIDKHRDRDGGDQVPAKAEGRLGFYRPKTLQECRTIFDVLMMSNLIAILVASTSLRAWITTHTLDSLIGTVLGFGIFLGLAMCFIALQTHSGELSKIEAERAKAKLKELETKVTEPRDALKHNTPKALGEEPGLGGDK